MSGVRENFELSLYHSTESSDSEMEVAEATRYVCLFVPYVGGYNLC